MQQRFGSQAVRRLIQSRPSAASSTIQRGFFDYFKKEVKSPPENVEGALHSDIRYYFRQYCIRRDAGEECFLFLDDLRDYEDNPDIKKAINIYTKYIDPEGKYALNLQGGRKSRKDHEKQIDNGLNPSVFEEKKDTLFNDVRKAVIADLSNPYIAFKKGESGVLHKEYKEWLEPF